MKRKIQYIISSFLILFVASFTFFAHRYQVNSYGVIMGAKDTLSNPQLSYFSRLNVGVTQGDSFIRINTSNVGFTVPSNSTNNLFVGDTIAIGTTGLGNGTSGPITLYTIKDLGDTGSIELNTGIGQSNAFVGAAVIATRSSIHTINFTTTGNITSGFWQVLIKATNRVGETQNDGIPDQTGFDLGQDVGVATTGPGTRLKQADVTCPFGVGITAFAIGTTTIGTNLYHTITCWQGLGITAAPGVGTSIVIGRDLTLGSQLINPTPNNIGITRSEGNADVYTFLIRHLDASQGLVDQTQGKIAVVEAVRVTATVDPTLSFSIGSTNATMTGGTACGNSAYGTNANNTTADSVAFGSIVLNQSNDLAQLLNIVTNSDSGYAVTVYEDRPMHSVADGTTIPDTVCNGTCTMSVGTTWSNVSNSGFGYSVQNFNLGTGTSIFAAPFYKPFGSGYANAQQIMRNAATPQGLEQAYVCYRITAATSQEASNYEAKLIYTATATF